METFVMSDQQTAAGELIVVDWGTTNFRAFLLDKNAQIIKQVSAASGVLAVSNGQFEAALNNYISDWCCDKHIPVIMAGMVGSKVGWQDTGYLHCPVSLSKSAQHLVHLDVASSQQKFIVPGFKYQPQHGASDVMRGEEVQVFGALSIIEQEQGVISEAELARSIFCLPGTHSKWACVSKDCNGESVITRFSTHMTGEVFDLVTKHSILSAGLTQQNKEADTDLSQFLHGVSCSQSKGGLLHHLFSARTLQLENKLPEAAVYSYISGLIVGAELHSVIANEPVLEHIYLIGNNRLNNLYSAALLSLGYSSTILNSSQASINGMFAIAKQAELISSIEVTL
ncbi:hypothetical protein B5G52_05025 [Pseudoalteromonas sp. A601]|nr:hypothetical protein B5G52_05025 [Pseudoalteromonas sp. A601]